MWELLTLRTFFPVLLIAQLMLGSGVILGLGLFLADIDRDQARLLSSGAAVFPLMVSGFIMLPEQIALRRIAGDVQYVAALPVPRIAMFVSTVAIWALVALPASLASIAVARLRYGDVFDVSPDAGSALLTVAIVSAALGFSLGHGIRPTLVGLATQLLIFVIVLFAPVAYPREQLPDWLAWLHQWLPVEHSAIIVRAGLTDGLVVDTTRSYATLSVWFALAALIAHRVATRRG